MHRRLGNGMVLWLGGALIAHAALLALPGSAPDGPASRASGLQVRLEEGVEALPAKAHTPGGAPTSATEVTQPPPPAAPTPHRMTAAVTTVETAVPTPSPMEPTRRDALDGLPGNAVPAPPREAARAVARLDRAAIGRHRVEQPRASSTTQAPHETATGSRAVIPPADQVPARRTVPTASGTPGVTVARATRPDAVPTVPAVSSRLQATASAGGAAASGDEARRTRLLELTDRLHRAIEREKRYPLSARRLGREGTASVAFQLRPDGAIDGLKVAASSGEPALDRAALRAVQGISPFGEAGSYLDATAPFRVDIAFRLR